MNVVNVPVTCGVTSVARRLGVSYVHLWHVLAGKTESVSLVLKVNRECPSLFASRICRIPWKQIIKENKCKYVYNPETGRYNKLAKYRRKGGIGNGSEHR